MTTPARMLASAIKRVRWRGFLGSSVRRTIAGSTLVGAGGAAGRSAGNRNRAGRRSRHLLTGAWRGLRGLACVNHGWRRRCGAAAIGRLLGASRRGTLPVASYCGAGSLPMRGRGRPRADVWRDLGLRGAPVLACGGGQRGGGGGSGCGAGAGRWVPVYVAAGRLPVRSRDGDAGCETAGASCAMHRRSAIVGPRIVPRPSGTRTRRAPPPVRVLRGRASRPLHHGLARDVSSRANAVGGRCPFAAFGREDRLGRRLRLAGDVDVAPHSSGGAADPVFDRDPRRSWRSSARELLFEFGLAANRVRGARRVLEFRRRLISSISRSTGSALRRRSDAGSHARWGRSRSSSADRSAGYRSWPGARLQSGARLLEQSRRVARNGESSRATAAAAG